MPANVVSPETYTIGHKDRFGLSPTKEVGSRAFGSFLEAVAFSQLLPLALPLDWPLHRYNIPLTHAHNRHNLVQAVNAGMAAFYEILSEVRQEKSPVELVVNECGTIDGIVKLLDVFEAIVGDIPRWISTGIPQPCSERMVPGSGWNDVGG